MAASGQDSRPGITTLGIRKLAFEVPDIGWIDTTESESVQLVSGGANLYQQHHRVHGVEVGSDIWVIDAREGKPRKLISGGSHPAWSPDGSQLAYCTWQGEGFGQIEVVNADGSGRRQITNLKGGACFPDWSPDGTKIAFTALSAGDSERNLRGAKRREIFVVDRNGGDPVPIAPGYGARWSPGGSLLIFLSGRAKDGTADSLWLATADGKKRKDVMTSDRKLEGAAWLPNGRGIVFSGIQDERYSIFSSYLDGTQRSGNPYQEIAGDHRANWREPEISPDGKHLIAVKDCAHGYWDPPNRSGCPSIVFLELGKNEGVTLAVGTNYSVVWDK